MADLSLDEGLRTRLKTAPDDVARALLAAIGGTACEAALAGELGDAELDRDSVRPSAIISGPAFVNAVNLLADFPAGPAQLLLARTLRRSLAMTAATRDAAAASEALAPLVRAAAAVTTQTVQDVLLDATAILAAHSATPSDLTAWLNAAAAASAPTRAALMLALARAARNSPPRAPRAVFSLDAAESGLLGPHLHAWPFAEGFTFATWLYVESRADSAQAAAAAAAVAASATSPLPHFSPAAAAAAAAAAAGGATKHYPRLYSMISTSGAGFEAFFHGPYLVVTVADGAGVRSAAHFAHAFEPAKWVFVAVSHAPVAGGGEARLYLDGGSPQTLAMPYPVPARHAPLAFCCVGTNPPAHLAGLGLGTARRQCALHADLGPVYLASLALAPGIVHRLAARGPDHLPSFGASAPAPSSPWSAGWDAGVEEAAAALDADLAPSLVWAYHPLVADAKGCPDACATLHPWGGVGAVTRPGAPPPVATDDGPSSGGRQAKLLGATRPVVRPRLKDATWALALGPASLLQLIPPSIGALPDLAACPVAESRQPGWLTAASATIQAVAALVTAHPPNISALAAAGAGGALAHALRCGLGCGGYTERDAEDAVAAVEALAVAAAECGPGLAPSLVTDLVIGLLADFPLWRTAGPSPLLRALQSIPTVAHPAAVALQGGHVLSKLLAVITAPAPRAPPAARDAALVAAELLLAAAERSKLRCLGGGLGGASAAQVASEALVHAMADAATRDPTSPGAAAVDAGAAAALWLAHHQVSHPSAVRSAAAARPLVAAGVIPALLALLRRDAVYAHGQVDAPGDDDGGDDALGEMSSRPELRRPLVAPVVRVLVALSAAGCLAESSGGEAEAGVALLATLRAADGRLLSQRVWEAVTRGFDPALTAATLDALPGSAVSHELQIKGIAHAMAVAGAGGSPTLSAFLGGPDWLLSLMAAAVAQGRTQVAAVALDAAAALAAAGGWPAAATILESLTAAAPCSAVAEGGWAWAAGAAILSSCLATAMAELSTAMRGAGGGAAAGAAAAASAGSSDPGGAAAAALLMLDEFASGGGVNPGSSTVGPMAAITAAESALVALIALADGHARPSAPGTTPVMAAPRSRSGSFPEMDTPHSPGPGEDWEMLAPSSVFESSVDSATARRALATRLVVSTGPSGVPLPHAPPSPSAFVGTRPSLLVWGGGPDVSPGTPAAVASQRLKCALADAVNALMDITTTAHDTSNEFVAADGGGAMVSSTAEGDPRHWLALLRGALASARGSERPPPGAGNVPSEAGMMALVAAGASPRDAGRAAGHFCRHQATASRQSSLTRAGSGSGLSPHPPSPASESYPTSHDLATAGRLLAAVLPGRGSASVIGPGGPSSPGSSPALRACALGAVVAVTAEVRASPGSPALASLLQHLLRRWRPLLPSDAMVEQMCAADEASGAVWAPALVGSGAGTLWAADAATAAGAALRAWAITPQAVALGSCPGAAAAAAAAAAAGASPGAAASAHGRAYRAGVQRTYEAWVAGPDWMTGKTARAVAALAAASTVDKALHASSSAAMAHGAARAWCRLMRRLWESELLCVVIPGVTTGGAHPGWRLDDVECGGRSRLRFRRWYPRGPPHKPADDDPRDDEHQTTAAAAAAAVVALSSEVTTHAPGVTAPERHRPPGGRLHPPGVPHLMRSMTSVGGGGGAGTLHASSSSSNPLPAFERSRSMSLRPPHHVHGDLHEGALTNLPPAAPQPSPVMTAADPETDASGDGVPPGIVPTSSVEGHTISVPPAAPGASGGAAGRPVHDFPASLVELLAVTPGRLQLTTRHIRFVPTGPPERFGASQAAATSSRTLPLGGARVYDWPLSLLLAIHTRRHLLRRSALELFFADRRTALVDLFDPETPGQPEGGRAAAATAIAALKPPHLVDGGAAAGISPAALLRRSGRTAAWCARKLSNFDYLMALNTLAGRSYSDLTQYPVMPWVLADYTSPVLDLNDPATFRDLTKPVGALDAKRAAKFQERYDGFDDPAIPKFHYGSHYSSAGTVLYFLLRAEPFASAAVAMQGGTFDVADRLFSDIGATWRGCLHDMSDVKELVPELFCLPDCLRNAGNLRLGRRQCGTLVGDVVLPPWANGSPEEFIRLHRAALESEHVSSHLHSWIDLVFGAKQRGPAAVDAQNVFFYLTYEGGVDLAAITDPAAAAAVRDQITYFGQTPSQLMTAAHPRRGPPDDGPTAAVGFLRSPGDAILVGAPPGTWRGLPAASLRPIQGPSGAAVVTVGAGSKAMAVASHTWLPTTPDVATGGPCTLLPDARASLAARAAAAAMPLARAAFARLPFAGFLGGALDAAARLGGAALGATPRGGDDSEEAQSAAGSGALPRLAGVWDHLSPGVIHIGTQGRHILTGGHRDGALRVWSADRGRLLEVAHGHVATVTAIAGSPGGRVLLSGARDGTLALWTTAEPPRGNGRGSGRGTTGWDDEDATLTALEAAIAIAGAASQSAIAAAAAATGVGGLPGGDNGASPSGTTSVRPGWGGGRPRAYLFGPAAHLRGHGGSPVTSCAVCPELDLAASCSLARGCLLHALSRGGRLLRALPNSPGLSLALGTQGHVLTWEQAEGGGYLMRCTSINGHQLASAPLRACESHVVTMATTAEGGHLLLAANAYAGGTGPGELILRHLPSLAVVQRWLLPEGAGVSCLGLTPDGAMAIVSGSGGQVAVLRGPPPKVATGGWGE